MKPATNGSALIAHFSRENNKGPCPVRRTAAQEHSTTEEKQKMGFLASLFVKTKKAPPEESGMTRLQIATREQTRRELITMALRDALKRHGLAHDCIAAKGLPCPTADGQRGMHIQLVWIEGQPALAAYVVAIESAVKAGLRRLDPLSPSWLSGFSWRFEPGDRTSWPQFPQPRPRTAAALASSVMVRKSTDALENLLQGGDDAHRHRQTAHGDFSPTLPMQALR